ncbi:SET domain-containing protein [Cylindrobasidium torrendii FP15055 ss-10]|uniref:SET domain-containing protein n=1 Tax=Cylindrobasidium torrendii FP15055 ss-10 TaxID=1314674 RepID=A0A0D7BF36_9AGAR|nr:SET domain-containing protein [Cylindrobasidium torrendii FP15055 ss-10]
MSFSDLRKSRKTQSFVGIPAKQEASEPVVTAPDLHKNLPSHLEVRTTQHAGRGLYAVADIPIGSIILATRPHVAVLSTPHLENHCSHCFGAESPQGLKRCTQCLRVRYCDATCQSKDWSLHKHECPALQRWEEAVPSADMPQVPSDAVRAIARILWLRQKKGFDSVMSRELDAMQSHRQTLPVSSAEIHTHLSHALVQYLGLRSPQDLAQFNIHSAADLLDITSRFTTNTFTVMDTVLSPLGASVSPTVALFNHSCQPNAVVVFPRAQRTPRLSEPQMQVIALRHISAGEEVLSAYIDITMPRAIRQEALKETYNFDCKCTLCTNPPAVCPQESMYCPKACGGVCPLPTEDNPLAMCTQCKSAVRDTDQVLDGVRVGQEALDKATALQFTDPAKSLQLTSKLIPILTSVGLTPSAHPLLALCQLQKSFPLPEPLTQDALDDAIRVTSKAVTGLVGILPEVHPVVGITLFELAKLLAVDEPEPRDTQVAVFPPSGPPRLKLAYDTLLRARASLLCGMGVQSEGGQVGAEVREMLVALEHEIAVWKDGVKNVLADIPK